MDLVLRGRTVFESVETERLKKIESLCVSATDTERVFLNDLKKFERFDNEIHRALDYAKTLDFLKSALRSSYLSHPIRVANFLLRIDPSVRADALVTAVLHNVPEVTSVSLPEIERAFGGWVSSAIRILLVDRSIPFSAQKEAYYNRLGVGEKEVMLIKLLDKMDNLFVLCLNPDEAVRREYVHEIREKLLGFAHAQDRGLGAYLEELLENADQAGFSQTLKDRLKTYQET